MLAQGHWKKLALSQQTVFFRKWRCIRSAERFNSHLVDTIFRTNCLSPWEYTYSDMDYPKAFIKEPDCKEPLNLKPRYMKQSLNRSIIHKTKKKGPEDGKQWSQQNDLDGLEEVKVHTKIPVRRRKLSEPIEESQCMWNGHFGRVDVANCELNWHLENVCLCSASSRRNGR